MEQDLSHNYLGHIFLGRTYACHDDVLSDYTGNTYTRHNYAGHEYIGRNYTGHTYTGRNITGRKYSCQWQARAVFGNEGEESWVDQGVEQDVGKEVCRPRHLLSFAAAFRRS